MRYAPIGIPGVTKMYEAKLTNFGLFPVRVQVCGYVSDTLTPGTMVAYNIERWDSRRRAWVKTLEFAKPEFCTPAPTSMGSTNWVRAWLWPGRSISTEEEATGARGPFKKGDRLRFVVVADVTGSHSRSSYATHARVHKADDDFGAIQSSCASKHTKHRV